MSSQYHIGAVHEIANKVEQLVMDERIRARFAESIEQLCKMVEKYGQERRVRGSNRRAWADQTGHSAKTLSSVRTPFGGLAGAAADSTNVGDCWFDNPGERPERQEEAAHLPHRTTHYF